MTETMFVILFVLGLMALSLFWAIKRSNKDLNL